MVHQYFKSHNLTGRHMRYVELMNFQMEVTNILETRAIELTDKEKVPVIKDWLGHNVLIKTFTHEEKENAELQRVSFQA